MLPVQVGSRCCCDEELGAVCVLPRVRHAEEVLSVVAGGGVYPDRVCARGALGPLVVEAAAVYGLSARAVPLCRVAALDHEALDHAVEGGALVVEGEAAELAEALLARAEAAEVFHRPGCDVFPELEDYPPDLVVVDGDVHEAADVGPFLHRHRC